MWVIIGYVDLSGVERELRQNWLVTPSLPDTTGVVLATHLLDDVQQLCDRVILLDGGRKVAEHAVDADTDLLAHFRAERSTAAAS